ncbi:MAG: hypothetical protein HC877_23075 [Thioploca sp.]|nr:hypothetical protein [Thioploca sp.]
MCQQIHKEGGLDGKSIPNIWTAFLVKATSLLNPTGVLAFVLPGELLQVSYAEKIQSFLKNRFKFIEILTFQELVFPTPSQDVVVIFAYKEAQVSGIGYTQVRNIDSLDKPVSFSQRIPNKAKLGIKWSNFVLSDRDLNFLFDIAKNVSKISNCCTSTPGIVTAANKFFIVNKKNCR